MLVFANLSFWRTSTLLPFTGRDDISTAPTSFLPVQLFLSAVFRPQLVSFVVCLLNQVHCSWVTGELHSSHAVQRLPSAADKPNVVRLHAVQMSLRNNGFPLAAWRMHCVCSDIRGVRQLRPAWSENLHGCKACCSTRRCLNVLEPCRQSAIVNKAC